MGDRFKMTERLNAYCSILAGAISQGEYESALAILKKMKESSTEEGNEVNVDDLIHKAKETAYLLDTYNPFDDGDRLGLIYNALDEIKISWLDILSLGIKPDHIMVPQELIKEMDEKIDASAKNILIPEAEKFSLGLDDLINKYKDSHFTLTSMVKFYAKVLQEMYKDNDNVEVIYTSIYEYEFSAEKYDAILSVPIFGARGRAEETTTFISRDYEMIAIENLLLHLNSDGFLSIVLPARITYGTGRTRQLRDFIQSMYCLKEISEMPNGIFERTGIKTYLFTLTTGRTDEVVVKKYKAVTDMNKNINELTVEDETFVLSDELAENGDWNINRIFAAQDEEWIKYSESSVRKQELGNVAEIFRGRAVSKKDSTGNIGVVNISNIGEYEIDYSSLDYIEEEERRIVKYILKDGDLLLPARGTAIRTAVFKEQPYTCIASSNVIVIRAIDESLSTTFLKIFLDSPIGKKILLNKQQGTQVMNISYRELNSIEIPFPTIDEQNKIADEYIKEYKVYKKTIEEAEEKWSDVVLSLQNRI